MSKSKREKNATKAKNNTKPTGSGDGGKVLKTGNLKTKGVNFYHNKEKVAKLNMLRGGKAVRDRDGKIIKAAAFQSSDAPVARIQPDRRWFGNTRVVGQQQLDEFRKELSSKTHDSYQVLLNRSKLPMSLLVDRKHEAKMNLLQSESFEYTFGRGAQRKRPKLAISNLEELAQSVGEKTESYREAPEKDTLLEEAKDPLFNKGQSKRIWNELYKVIDSSDVVVHVLDARDPLGTRCRNVEAFIKKEAPHKHLLFLLNKCDLIPPSVTSKWVKYLSKDYPTIAFHANINNPFGKGTFIQLLRQYSRLHKDKKQISVGFVGYPNIGKSSIINTLRQKAVCSVAPIPGQTKVWQYVTLMKRIYLIDCPGVVPSAVNDGEAETVLKGVVRLENVQTPEDYIPALIARVKREYLSRTYDVWQWEGAEDFLQKLAIKMGKLGKGGEPDVFITARMVLQDWLRGRIPYFTLPPVAEGEQPEGQEAEEEEITSLEQVQPEVKEEPESEDEIEVQPPKKGNKRSKKLD